MPTVTIERSNVTVDETVAALKQALGSRYTITAREGSTHAALTVKLSTLSFAHVHLVPEGEATKLRVHGGGLLIGRIVNELGIARKVAAAIRRAPELGGGS